MRQIRKDHALQTERKAALEMKEWEKNIRKIAPYIPGEQPKRRDIVKLNTNENPYPPSPGVLKILRETDGDALRRYPDPAASELTGELAAFYGVSPEQVFAGVGSDDVLAMCYLTFFNSGRPILFPDVTYSFYDVWAEMFRVPYRCVPLDESFAIRAEDYYGTNGGIIFPNPNAPTGAFLELGEIEKILQHNPDVIVIVDEAYIDFGGVTALGLLGKYDNLLIVRTFSKAFSLAGLRIGFAIGHETLIRYLWNVRNSVNSYTLNAPSVLAGAQAVRDMDYYKENMQRVICTRERTAAHLRELGFVFPGSSANFLFARHETIPGKQLFEALREQGIYVRYFPKPRIDDYLRITIGTDEQMDRLLTFLRDYIRRSNL